MRISAGIARRSLTWGRGSCEEHIFANDKQKLYMSAGGTSASAEWTSARQPDGTLRRGPTAAAAVAVPPGASVVLVAAVAGRAAMVAVNCCWQSLCVKQFTGFFIEC
mmetsp:Transcript_4195/g.11601  ORF Transcript_4195/g.11601 Transcript_4195/m.11601 type:complete len:107 (+) Transcript_4195:239-559(+)